MVRLRLVVAFWTVAALGAGMAHAEVTAGEAGADKAGPAPGAGRSTPSGGDAAPDADTTVTAGVPMVDIAKQDATGARYGLGVRARWVSVPSFLLGTFLSQSKALSSYTVGLEGIRRHGDFDFVLGVAWQSLSPPDGNWLGKGKNPATDTDYVQFRGLGAVSIDAAFIRRNELSQYVTFHYGGGLGLGIVTGKMLRTSDGTSGCSTSPGDVTKCYPNLAPPCSSGPCSESQLAASSGTTDTPERGSRFTDGNIPPVYPIINLLTGLDFRIPNADGLELKVEVGYFFPYFFAGGGLSYRI